MQSFVTVQPGETLSCVGCHEPRTQTPAVSTGGTLGGHAPQAQPDRTGEERARRARFPPRHPADSRSTLREVPRFRPARGTRDPQRRPGPHVFAQLRQPHGCTTSSATAQPGPEQLSARALGSSASPLLLTMLEPGHHGVGATAAEKALVRLWIDTGAPYPGTYAALGSGMVGGYAQNRLDRQDYGMAQHQGGSRRPRPAVRRVSHGPQSAAGFGVGTTRAGRRGCRSGPMIRGRVIRVTCSTTSRGRRNRRSCWPP